MHSVRCCCYLSAVKILRTLYSNVAGLPYGDLGLKPLLDILAPIGTEEFEANLRHNDLRRLFLKSTVYRHVSQDHFESLCRISSSRRSLTFPPIEEAMTAPSPISWIAPPSHRAPFSHGGES